MAGAAAVWACMLCQWPHRTQRRARFPAHPPPTPRLAAPKPSKPRTSWWQPAAMPPASPSRAQSMPSHQARAARPVGRARASMLPAPVETGLRHMHSAAAGQPACMQSWCCDLTPLPALQTRLWPWTICPPPTAEWRLLARGERPTQSRLLALQPAGHCRDGCTAASLAAASMSRCLAVCRDAGVLHGRMAAD
jgi:hypothetical protein